MRTIYEINKELEESNEQLKQDVLYWQKKSQRLEKRKKEIYDGFMANTQELCDTTKEIKKLNKIIDKAIHYINLNQDSKSLCLNYEQLKALRGILRQDEFYLMLFEEQLKELKGSDE
jgi:hypothetical protein